MLGCAAAFLFERHPAAVRKYFGSRLLLAGSLFAYAACCRSFDARVPYGDLVPSLSITMITTIIVVSAAACPPVWPLTSGGMVWVGRRSYGIYLYHFVVFQLADAHLRIDGEVGQAAKTLGQIALTFVLAGLSYRFVESPMLRLKRRFGVSAS